MFLHHARCSLLFEVSLYILTMKFLVCTDKTEIQYKDIYEWFYKEWQHALLWSLKSFLCMLRLWEQRVRQFQVFKITKLLENLKSKQNQKPFWIAFQKINSYFYDCKQTSTNLCFFFQSVEWLATLQLHR